MKPAAALGLALAAGVALADVALFDVARADAALADVARLAGHGGPIRDVAAVPGGALTASFDNAVGVWALAGGTARHVRWLDGHEAAVNRVIPVPGGRALSVGDDFAAVLWDVETGAALRRFEGHRGKVMGVALSPDGALAVTASWDGSAALWSLAGKGGPVWTLDRLGPLNDAAFSADGATLWLASGDGTIRAVDAGAGAVRRTLVSHGFGVNRIAVNEAAGWIAYGAVDGGTRAVRTADGETLADLTLDRRPILALALSPDGHRLAVGDGDGYIMVVDTADWSIMRDFRAAARGPVWALAFTADGRALIAGGLDDAAAIWPLQGGGEAVLAAGAAPRFHRDPATMGNGARQFYRKCSICHSLDADSDRRAGPTLKGLFGRRAGTVAGYAYSDALDGSPIVWTAETIGALFDIGPDHYVPGTKMPMQRITAAQDRADLIAFLRAATRP